MRARQKESSRCISNGVVHTDTGVYPKHSSEGPRGIEDHVGRGLRELLIRRLGYPCSQHASEAVDRGAGAEGLVARRRRRGSASLRSKGERACGIYVVRRRGDRAPICETVDLQLQRGLADDDFLDIAEE